MQISKSYRFIAISLAFIIAVSSLGMSVNVHYCQGALSGVSLLSKTKKGCHDVTSTPTKKSCCKSSSSDEEPCCSDETSIVSLDFDSPGINNTVAIDLEFAKALPIVFNHAKLLVAPVISATGLDPPDAILLSGRDLRITHSSFLC